MRTPHSANDRSLELLERIAVAVESLVPSPKSSLDDITDEERGLLLILRLKKPTMRSVAKAMGLADHTCLRKYPAILEGPRRWRIMQTVTAGSGRSVTDYTLIDGSID